MQAITMGGWSLRPRTVENQNKADKKSCSLFCKSK
jgi:hypothetical protein